MVLLNQGQQGKLNKRHTHTHTHTINDAMCGFTFPFQADSKSRHSQVAVPCVAKEVLPRPGNLHGIKSHAYYVGAGAFFYFRSLVCSSAFFGGVMVLTLGCQSHNWCLAVNCGLGG